MELAADDLLECCCLDVLKRGAASWRGLGNSVERDFGDVVLSMDRLAGDDIVGKIQAAWRMVS